MLTVRGLTLQIGCRALCRDLSARFEPGQCWAVLGPNGSGKTTLLHTLAGLRSAAAASAVRLGETALYQLPRRQAARQIGLLLQEETGSYWGTVLGYALLGAFPHDPWSAPGSAATAAAASALASLELQGTAARNLATLSGGERQRARLAQLLVQDPQIYCLDEPLLHLDIRHQLLVMKLFQRLANEQGKLVIMVLHDTLWAGRFCDHALLLYDGGSVVQGGAAQILTKKNLEALYGCDLDLVSSMQPL